MHLLDRRVLTEVACPCYSIIKSEFDALAAKS
jgi:hypothetical protein